LIRYLTTWSHANYRYWPLQPKFDIVYLIKDR